MTDDQKTTHPPSITRFVLQAMRPYPWQVIAILWVSCYWAIHISLQPYVIKLIIDRVSLNPSLSNVLIPVLAYIAISLAFTLNFRFYEFVALRFFPQLKAKLIAETTDSVTKHSFSFFQNQLAGGLTDKIKNLSNGTVQIIQIFIDRFFSHFLALIIASATLMTVHVGLSVILLIWVVLLLGISILATKKARILSHEYSETNSLVMGTIVDRFTNILNVRLFANSNYEKTNLNRKLKKNIEKDVELRYFLLKLQTLQGLATAAMISGCLLLMILSVHSKTISIGDFALVLTLTLSFADIMWHLAHEISHYSEVHGMVSQGLTLVYQKHDIVDAKDATPLNVTRGEIQFDKVHFKYPNAEPLFSNKSITLNPAQKIGLVGYSGSGKTTFVNLILRLFDIDSGKILIDDQDIKKVTQDSLHESIGMIPQDPTLFHRSLLDNIRYGRLSASEEEVIKAAKKAHAHEFIIGLSKGYDTMVGERGIKLSGGQRQRIAIARAILKNAPILILDEATSALDSVTESLIKESLAELMEAKTTLVIAHRLSTLLHMDRILVFKNGKIVEDGTHTALLKENGYYKKLWNAQVGGFIPESVGLPEPVEILPEVKL